MKELNFFLGNLDIWQLQGSQTLPCYTFVDGHSNKISHLQLSDLSDSVISAAGPFLHVHQKKSGSFRTQQVDVQQWVRIKCTSSKNKRIITVKEFFI